MAVKALCAGKLRHRLEIQQKTVTRTEQGGVTRGWATVKTLWASIEPKTGREYYFSEATRADMTHLITTRAQATAQTPDMRGLFNGRYFNFVEVQRIKEIRHEQNIAAIEQVGTSQNAPSTASTLPSVQKFYETVEWDFTTTTTTNETVFTFPSGKVFFLDAVEVLCTTLSGTVVTQPTITVGIAGNLTKYLSRLTTLLTAVNKRQAYTTLLSNDGTTTLTVKQSVAGAVSSGGTYKGLVLVKGVLVG